MEEELNILWFLFLIVRGWVGHARQYSGEKNSIFIVIKWTSDKSERSGGKWRDLLNRWVIDKLKKYFVVITQIDNKIK